MKLVNMADLKSAGEILTGSSPVRDTLQSIKIVIYQRGCVMVTFTILPYGEIKSHVIERASS